jgi:hypothetical protein
MKNKSRVIKPPVKPHPEMAKVINRLMASRQIRAGKPRDVPIEPDADRAWSTVIYFMGWAMVGVMAVTLAYVYFFS